MRNLIITATRFFFILLVPFSCIILCSFDSQEHKILGDIGFSRVNIRSTLRLPFGLDNFYSPANYFYTWEKAKYLAVGYYGNNVNSYKPGISCQDNCYTSLAKFAQLEGNKNNWVEDSAMLPSDIWQIESYIDDSPVQLTFGELMALYGDYRRTLYCKDGHCYLTDNRSPVVKFQSPASVNTIGCPAPVSTEQYLRSIANGLWPPYGEWGNIFGNWANYDQCDNAAWWGDEMMRIANVNETHFSTAAVVWYVGMHRLALSYVEKARFNKDYWIQALHYEASALHTLTDLFCLGHVVTSREESSYQTVLADKLTNAPPYLWMENVLKMGGAIRNIDGSNPGSLGTISTLPAIADASSTKWDYMPTVFPAVVTKQSIAGLFEKKNHDEFNRKGAVVRNIRGDRFQIYGDGKLHLLDADSRRVIEDAVTVSLQSLFDAYDVMNNDSTADKISKPGSSFFGALKYIPVYIEQDPDRYFYGMWTAYAEYAKEISGASALIINSSCSLDLLDGMIPGSLVPLTKKGSPCDNFSATNTYPNVKIGNQVWMKANLDVPVFRDGTLIQKVTSKEQWVRANQQHQPAWCYPEYNDDNGVVYGKIYNWYALIDPRLAPKGWHISSNDEWTSLLNTIGPNPGGALKSTGDLVKGKGMWAFYNSGATNSTGFSGIPAGMVDFMGDYFVFGVQAYWWIGSLGNNGDNYLYPHARVVSNDGVLCTKFGVNEGYGCSVRCVKD